MQVGRLIWEHMSFIKKHRSKIYFIIFLTVTILTHYFWLTQYIKYPRMDEGHYFTLSREIYTEYNTSGTLPALKMAYMRKHWKPILHPVLAAPFFIFAGGNSLLALTYYLCFIYAIFLMVIYIYLKRYLNAEMTLMGLLTTTCIPWISGTMIGFNSEFTFITASLSFFVITENLKDLSSISKTLTISLCLFFMFALRPVEAALLFSTSSIFFKKSYF